ncbi:MAG: rod shape-determining protein [Pseudomonadota bacterium]
MQSGLLGVEGKPVDAAEWSIGVDFGTAFSKAAATRMTFEHGAALREIRPLRIGQAAGWDRPFLTPSSMFLDRHCVHFGANAVDRLLAANQDERELVRSFKTILGANDFEEALNFYPRPCVDPDRMFRLRDLLVLYLAYLLALVDIAAGAAFNRTGSVINSSRLRFSRPGWIPGRIAAAHEAMTSLFNEAHIVGRILGAKLLSPDGLPYHDARQALDYARAHPQPFANLDGGIYEASAVGVCHYSDPNAPNCLLVVDIGAGTTDIAGLIRAPYRDDIRVIRTARRTIDVAGDNFDAALLDLVVSKAKKLKSRADRAALWRRVIPNVRDLKEELFRKGVVQIQFRRFKIKVTVKEFEQHPDFKSTLAEIKRVYETALKEVLQVGVRERVGTVGVVLAGGGAHLPAVRKMVARKRWFGPPIKIVNLPTTPAWAHELGSAAEFESLFAQLSAAFGAAISCAEQGATTVDESGGARGR